MTVEARWAALGERLSQLREAAGLSGKRLAESVGWAPSKTSKIQTAAQAPTDADIRTWCEATGADAATLEELLAELRDIRLEQARWKSRLRSGHQPVQSEIAQAEAVAGIIRVFENVLVPGLVQTPDYARAVFTAMSEIKNTPNDAEAAVVARLQRQNILYDSSKTIELLVTEAALRSPIAPPGVMAAQYDRLTAVVGVPSVRFGIIPLDVQLPVPLLHGVAMLDDVVLVETLSTELVTRDPDDVAMYGRALDTLWKTAAEGEHARAILARLLGR